MLWDAPRGRSGLRGMRDSPALPRGDTVSVPSAAEVEHADWPTLQRMCQSLGLNPKGRSGVVRMRVLDHVRRRAHPEAWRAGRDHMAALLTRSGFKEQAARVLLAAADAHPEAPFLRSAAGTSFLKAGRPEVALGAFGLPMPADAAGIEGAINHGAALLVLGRTREAVDLFQKALEADPDRAEALNNLGVAQLQLGQTGLAASNLVQAAKEVDSPRIRLNLANVPKTAPRPRVRKPAARKKQKP